jgi:putative ABC transport system substrate-binding protein
VTTNDAPIKKIGVILPIQHQAMDEIQAGFVDTLKKQYKGGVLVFLVRNASGDINLQRTIIEELRAKQVALFVPVSTNTTLMTLAMVQKTPIVSIASNYTEKDRQMRHPCNITAVNDSIPPKPQLDFMIRLIPNLNQITIVHSASDKVIQEVDQFSTLAKRKKIAVQDLMVQQLSELYTIANKVSKKSQLIFIVKDNLVASGIRTLVQAANYRKIPLVTSDDGTVENGAAFALGIPEYRLGMLGAQLATQVLQGKKPCQIPIYKIEQLSVFINKSALKQQGVSENAIKMLANRLKYKTIFVKNISKG